MKKIIFLILSVAFILPFTACGDNKVKTIEVNEVTHSVFYAPLYLAIENGYFEQEGLKINLTNGGGADNSMTAVLSGSAQIGLMGPETVIYVYKQGKKDCPKVFSQLTQRDGAFLVSRNAEPNFKWTDLRGKEILAGRKGGVPAMNFEYIMKENGMNINTDYTLNFDVQFNLMTSAFLQGTGDYCTVFEPTASEYEKQGKWHIVASVGEGGGEIPYTSFIALDSYISSNKDTLKSFVKALKKGMQFIEENTDYAVAEAIVKQFPSTTIKALEDSIKSYRRINAWKNDFTPTESSFDRLQNVMINAGELTKKVAYTNLVNYSVLNSL